MLAACCALAALSACSSDESQTLPAALLGKWYYQGSSGGITGDGMGDKAEGFIVIHANNTIDHHNEDGALVGNVAFTVRRGPTIYSQEDQWIVETERGLAEVLRVSEDGQTMSFSENVYDGIGRSYSRQR